MCGNKVIAVLAVVLVVCGVLAGRERPMREGERPEGFVQPERRVVEPEGRMMPPNIEQIKGRIEQLRVRAKEAEQEARWLRAEAAELERMLRRELGPGPGREPVGGVRAELRELQQGLDRAEREGRGGDAEELRGRIRQVKDEIGARERERGGKEFGEGREKVANLRRMAREAKGRGDMEESERLWADADKLEGALKGERGQRKEIAGVEDVRRKVAELKEAAMRAEREDRHDEAGRLREKAEMLVRDIEKGGRPPDIGDMQREIDRLHAMSREAKEAGEQEKAEALFREAEKINERLKGTVEGKKDRPAAPGLEREVGMLREEIGRLRRDVEELKRGLPAERGPREQERR